MVTWLPRNIRVRWWCPVLLMSERRRVMTSNCVTFVFPKDSDSNTGVRTVGAQQLVVHAAHEAARIYHIFLPKIRPNNSDFFLSLHNTCLYLYTPLMCVL